MPWFERWRRPSETGDEQLARLQCAAPERPVPAYLSDAELEEVLRRAEECLAPQPLAAP